MKEELRKISLEISADCHDILKIMAIKKKTNTKQFIRDVLEKLTNKNISELEINSQG